MRLESLREGATLALDQLRANKFRSGLTILGIVVGVATVMMMSAMIQGIRATITDSINAAGPQNFSVARFNINGVRFNSDGPPWGDNPKVTVEEAHLIGALPAVKTKVVNVGTNAEFSFGRQRLSNVSVSGQDAGWSNYTTGKIISGHDMFPADVVSANPVVIITEHLAEALFGALDPINRQVRLNGQPFRVIGVFQPEDNIFAALQKNYAIVPYTSAMKHLDAWDGMLSVFVVVAPGYTQAEAIDEVTSMMRTHRSLRPMEENNFAIQKQEDLIATFNKFTGVFFMVMISLSSVALLVGGVGVIAIMMIAVTERTREIGIRKAIGATKREILWQFLFESITVTFIGAAIGMILGAGGAFTVAALTPVPAAVPMSAIIAALSMAVMCGIVFGLWPAWRAARMDPVVALRYE
jgi:putative ABC transport system permease protein